MSADQPIRRTYAESGALTNWVRTLAPPVACQRRTRSAITRMPSTGAAVSCSMAPPTPWGPEVGHDELVRTAAERLGVVGLPGQSITRAHQWRGLTARAAQMNAQPDSAWRALLTAEQAAGGARAQPPDNRRTRVAATRGHAVRSGS